LVSEYIRHCTNNSNPVYYSAVREEKNTESVISRGELYEDSSFLNYVIENAGILRQHSFLPFMFLVYIQQIITNRFATNSPDNELPALVSALMFAGRDLMDPEAKIAEEIKEMYFFPKEWENVEFNSQQDLSSFLFGMLLDAVSILLRRSQTYNRTRLTYLFSAHVQFRKSPGFLQWRKVLFK
jgi:hypothetical protein